MFVIYTISLPLVPFQEADRNKPVSQTAGGRGERILVVDDEAELLKPVEELLQEIGYDTAFASSGREALSRYESWRPDVVLLDRSMPEMDGITCARKIISRDPGARIVLFSGYEEDGPDGIDARTREFIKGYITKPIDITELSRLLSQLLSE
jgi:two-component system chemotaxis response regulator CheY